MAGKHTKCCCGDCLIGEDYFDAGFPITPPPGDWDVVSGAWEVTGTTLRHTTPGLILTTLRQDPPINSTDYTIRFFISIVQGTGPWKIVCYYRGSGDYDWIELTEDAAMTVRPKFYRHSGGTDTLLMDDTTHPAGGDWTFGGEGDQLPFEICYSNTEWSIDSGQVIWTTCDSQPSSTLPPSPHGFVGFLQGEFDNFQYYIHWESNHSCEDCACYCWNPANGLDYRCFPETLHLTLIPVPGTQNPACGSPYSITLDLLQARPSPTDPGPPAVPYDLPPEKDNFWTYDPTTSGPFVLTDWDGEELWFRFLCHGKGEYELVQLIYGYTNTVFTFPAFTRWYERPGDPPGGLDGLTGTGRRGVVVSCDPLRIVFPLWEVWLREIGSGGPTACEPLRADFYDLEVTL